MEQTDEDPIAVLARERFGLDYLFPYQRLVAANVLDAGLGEAPGRQIVLLPTGFGKSLCFQLPALALPGPTVVAYPLLSLMEDQRRRLGELGIPCAVFRGGMDAGERRAAEDSVERGEAKLVVTNPESLARGRLLDFLAAAKPSHVAIDEAHCVSEWGETFRPAYLELGRVLERLDPPATSAFTATASPTVFEAVAARLFGGRDYRVIEGDPDRPNLSYAVLPTLSRPHSLERLARELPKPLIVFCSSREGAQIIAETLRARLGTDEARFYHAGLDKAEKKEVEAWFLASETGILAATCAYGMGVDKKNIRSIVHYEAPAAVEAYLQEAGRAGRDGKPARAVLLVGTDEETRHGEESDPGRRARRAAFLGYATAREGCRREALLGLLGSPLRGACSGCDRCEGAAKNDYEGAGEILGFVGANPRRFEEGRALALLRGEAGTEPPCCAGSGGLRGWRKDDAAAALRAAVKEGLVDLPAKGPWRGKLGPRKKETRPILLRPHCAGIVEKRNLSVSIPEAPPVKAGDGGRCL